MIWAVVALSLAVVVFAAFAISQRGKLSDTREDLDAQRRNVIAFKAALADEQELVKRQENVINRYRNGSTRMDLGELAGMSDAFDANSNKKDKN